MLTQDKPDPSYFDYYLSLRQKNISIIDAVSMTFEAYSKANTPTQVMYDYAWHAFNAPLGNKFIHNPYANDLPQDLKAIAENATLREQYLASPNVASPLLSDCENELAKDIFSAEVYYAQCARLESALIHEQVEPRFLTQVSQAHKAWLEVLYQKFARFIVESQNTDALLEKIEVVFDKDISQQLPVLSACTLDIANLFQYLKEEQFFESYYGKWQAERFQSIIDFSKAPKSKPFPSNKLYQFVMQSLNDQFIDETFKPCKQFFYQLMCDKTITLPLAINKMKKWSNYKWQQYKGTTLLDALENELSGLLATYGYWQSKYGIKPLYVLQTIKNSYGDEAPQFEMPQTPDIVENCLIAQNQNAMQPLFRAAQLLSVSKGTMRESQGERKSFKST